MRGMIHRRGIDAISNVMIFVTANNIVDALIEFTASEECVQSICSEEFYNWTGLEAVTDGFYDPVRSAMDYLGITEDDILGG